MMRVNSKFKSSFWRNACYILIVLALAVIASFLLFSNWKIFQKFKDSVSFRQTAEANLKDESGREAQLKIKVTELQTESGLEKEIRERFPVAKPGEEVIMIIPGNNSEATSDSGANSGGWWQKFLKWLKP
jgi:hypothetical protein